jgi:hypothetical protein
VVKGTRAIGRDLSRASGDGSGICGGPSEWPGAENHAAFGGHLGSHLLSGASFVIRMATLLESRVSRLRDPTQQLEAYPRVPLYR